MFQRLDEEACLFNDCGVASSFRQLINVTRYSFIILRGTHIVCVDRWREDCSCSTALQVMRSALCDVVWEKTCLFVRFRLVGPENRLDWSSDNVEIHS